MPQMCPNCSFDNPDEATLCSNCPSPLRGLLGSGTVLSGRYRVTSVLGCGAMGAVYLAEDQRLIGRRCAIKENRPDPKASSAFLARAREQFLAETSVLARLDHPNLPKVSDYFVGDNGHEYLVMDYVEGEDLESALQRSRRPLPEDGVLYWVDQVLDALTYLHSQRPQPIIHRDIKPSNLRLNLQGKVKLVDFGLVKLLDLNHPETKAELRGIGTPAYAPLEQFATSADHTDARSDIYALGATMYHLLTNMYPPDVHQRVLNPELLASPRILNPQLSEHTEWLILKAMEIHPSRRFQSAEEMRQALHGPVETLRTPPAPPFPAKIPAPQPAAKAPVSVWLFGLVGLLLVMAILTGVSLALFNENATPPPSTVVEGRPVDTPTEFIVQALGDAPTHTPTRVLEPTITETPTPEPTAVPTSTPTSTPTSPPTATQGPVVRGISASSLVGTIAYPVFNGKDYDLYFGQADGSGTRLYRSSASQPAFSPDGSHIAFHSWKLNSWGLLTMDISGSNQYLVANFVEDQLPTWSADGKDIVLLSRREGDRKSRLIRVGSQQERSQGVVLGEGEYPTISRNGQLIFKGWGSTGSGLHRTTLAFQDIQAITNADEDTAPAPSPDGQKIAFMSRRDGNWEIYLVNADGSNLVRLTEDPGQDGLPVWSPDGRVLAFASNRSGSWAIWAMTPAGKDSRLLFTMEGSPDGFVGTDINSSRGWTEERLSWTK